MSEIREALQWRIQHWHSADDASSRDPLDVALNLSDAGTSYLPVLQPKTRYSHYGARRRSLRVLGLDMQGAWVEDAVASGCSSWIYGSAEHCFGRAPFALSPLLWARLRYPELATLLWNSDEIGPLEDRYLEIWQRFVAVLNHTDDIGPIWLLRHGFAGTSAALGRLETPTLLASLVEALSSSSARLRQEAITGLHQTTPGNGYDRVVADLAADPDSTVRELVAMALGTLGIEQSARTVRILVAFLDDQQPNVQQAALHALVELGDFQARQPILSLLTPLDGRLHIEPLVQMTALLTLQTFWQSGDDALLLESLRNEEPAVRAGGAYVLGKRRIPAFQELRHLLWDEYPEVRVEAAYALAELNDEGSVSRIAELAQTSAVWYMNPIAQHMETESAHAQDALEEMEARGVSKG